MNYVAEDILAHYGVGKMDGAPGRGSGRYELGSGDNPHQHSGDFLSRIDKMQKQGMSEREIAQALGISTTQLRSQKAIAKAEERSILVNKAQELQEQGYNTSEIARIMGYENESSVRSLLNEKAEANMRASEATAQILKQAVDEKGMIDVGSGVARTLGVSDNKMRDALTLLERDGYYTFSGRVPQATNPGKYTTIKVLCPPETPYKLNSKGERVSSAIYDFANIHNVQDYTSTDNGESFHKSFEYPESMDSSRLTICYGDQGGLAKDGLIEIRPGVKDLSLGDSSYAQVRILVDGTHYLKGMAVYSDDLPDGVDVRFNTNKQSGTPALGEDKYNTVLKKIEDDPDNPFGSAIKIVDGQSYYDDPNGKYTNSATGKKQSLSLINKRADEGDWGKWSNELPSQFLSKQSEQLIKKQLNTAYADKANELAEISVLTNPTVKRNLLSSFADSCDYAAVHLKAAALPRQMYQVVLPLTSISDNEVYAPNYSNGETVALIRYPHGGTFEIPILKVNNNNAEGKKTIGSNALDAIGVNSSVTQRLSGADFDGDTVMVIPCNSNKSSVKIVSSNPLKGLEGFDPTLVYGGKEEGTYKSIGKNTQNEMGKISNLITDMTLKGATEDELARAVRHSMVIIDAAKHGLDYKASEADNDIDGLKRKYQSKDDGSGKYGGAATLISRAKSEVSVPKRQGNAIINSDGSISWKTADDLTYNVAKVNRSANNANATIRITDSGTAYIQVDGSNVWLPAQGSTKGYTTGDRVNASVVEKTRTQKSTQMAETSDAMTLVSSTRTPAELAYAEYANQMKALANEARKEMQATGKLEYNAGAHETYRGVVDKLTSQLALAEMNAPRERQAQLIASSTVAAKQQDNPGMTSEEKRKASQQALAAAREAVGAKRTTVTIDDEAWEAIQAGAISDSTLQKIINHTDIDNLKEKATPRNNSSELSTTQINMIKSLSASGYTNDDIAKRLGISVSSVRKYV